MYSHRKELEFMRLLASSKLGTLTVILAITASGCGGSSSHRVGGPAVSDKSEAPGDPAHNLLRNSDFSSGSILPWLTSFSRPAEGEAMVKNGAMCVNVKAGGANRWDAQLRHREMIVQKGHEYVVSFKAWASRNTNLTAKIGMSGRPYTDYWTKGISLTTEPQLFSYKFQMNHPDDPMVEFALHFGGHMIQGSGPIDLCFDDMVLSDPQFAPPPPPKPVVIPKVRVNQVGYIPSFSKVATFVSDAKDALEFQVVDASGKVVHTGKTTPRGPDAASGDSVHIIDFSKLTTPGKGYVIKVGQESSDPFDIDKGIYKTAKYDAFKYFYLNRSGIELKMPFTGKPDWARPAGHPKDEAPCSPAAKCDYTLDVTGGWYDAGDYGKYVVNGGISVWTLMNWYERSTAIAGGDTKAFGDLKDFIPESGNKIPDILDEARWELEFLLKMQVPEGKPNAGMAHHKMHDTEWTALGMAPHESKIKRDLRPVSTAATLNLAASAAQGARLFKNFDPKFADRCLKAAEVAWAAAKKNPSVLANPDDSTGGGPYDDKDLADEFYWAAAELWTTTGKAEYKKELDQSPLDKAIVSGDGEIETVMTWQRVDGLGKISMALAAPKDRNRYRDQITAVADQFVKTAEAEGYRLPLSAGKDGKYPWGSNSFVINNGLVLALAYDFTKAAKYRDAVVFALDYLFGRNAMGQSYVTGYGERPLQNPHHRFWSHQAVSSYPSAPPGVLSGGPNSGMEDPYVKAAGLPGCKPQRCFIDHSEAWSANEITINWNGPFMWALAWTDEQASR
ncbi:MAG TPA: glycoside hydrolase family 9 protein [Polyangiaceae bacterium]|nr:glycoside hydrolase family 9 protein [Polyangiaceae bacterium]